MQWICTWSTPVLLLDTLAGHNRKLVGHSLAREEPVGEVLSEKRDGRGVGLGAKLKLIMSSDHLCTLRRLSAWLVLAFMMTLTMHGESEPAALSCHRPSVT